MAHFRLFLGNRTEQAVVAAPAVQSAGSGKYREKKELDWSPEEIFAYIEGLKKKVGPVPIAEEAVPEPVPQPVQELVARAEEVKDTLKDTEAKVVLLEAIAAKMEEAVEVELARREMLRLEAEDEEESARLLLL